MSDTSIRAAAPQPTVRLPQAAHTAIAPKEAARVCAAANGESGNSSRWCTLLASALLLVVTLALYGRSLWFDFVWDDSGYIQQNYLIQAISPARLRAVWTRTFLGHYAPVHHTALMLLYALSKGRPWGFHLGQLLLHAACLLLVYVLLRKLEGGRVAFLAALLYAVHPTNVETVAWISETKSTLAFFFLLLSLLCFIRFRERGRLRDGLLCGLLLVISVLAKINTIVAPAIFLLYDYLREGRIRSSRLRSLAGYFLIAAIFVAVHLAAFHGSKQNLEDAYYGGLGTHLLNLPLLVSFYAGMTVYPHPLSAWHMFPVYEHLNWTVALAWLGLMAMLAALALAGAVYKNRSVVFWGFWFLIFLAPVLQIIPFPIWVADRYLYIPVIGGLVLASKSFFTVFDRLCAPWQRLAAIGAVPAVAAALAWQTWTYLPVWKNDLTLWEATTPTCLTSAYCHCNLGLALLRNGYNEQGIKELIRSVELRNSPRYLIRLGDAYTLTAHDYRQAGIAYAMAQKQGGYLIDAEFYAKLARLDLKSGDLDGAKQAVNKGRKIDPGDPSLLGVTAFLQWKLGNLAAARAAVGRVIAETAPQADPSGPLLLIWSDPVEVKQLLSALQVSSSPR